MAIKMLNPYLNFNGDAAKAIALYERFATNAEMVQTLADILETSAWVPIGASLVMISDAMPPPGQRSRVAKFDALSALRFGVRRSAC